MIETFKFACCVLLYCLLARRKDKPCFPKFVLGLHSKVVVLGKCRVAFVRRDQGCPVPNPARTGWHSRALQPGWWQLSDNLGVVCTTWRGSTLMQLFKICSSVEGAQDGAGQKGEEGTAESTCYRLMPPFPILPPWKGEESAYRRVVLVFYFTILLYN